MGDFKTFLETGNNGKNSDISDTLKKLPKRQQALLKGYEFKFQSGNSLKGDGDHVGYNDLQKKIICVAAPWRYSRQFTILHEIGHVIWDDLLTPEQKKQWESISKKGSQKLKQNAEELFCMCYANFYSDRPLTHFCDPKWDKFISNLDSN